MEKHAHSHKPKINILVKVVHSRPMSEECNWNRVRHLFSVEVKDYFSHLSEWKIWTRVSVESFYSKTHLRGFGGLKNDAACMQSLCILLVSSLVTKFMSENHDKTRNLKNKLQEMHNLSDTTVANHHGWILVQLYIHHKVTKTNRFIRLIWET